MNNPYVFPWEVKPRKRFEWPWTGFEVLGVRIPTRVKIGMVIAWPIMAICERLSERRFSRREDIRSLDQIVQQGKLDAERVRDTLVELESSDDLSTRQRLLELPELRLAMATALTRIQQYETWRRLTLFRWRICTS